MNHAATLEKDGLKANALSPCYVEKYNEVIRRFFSRINGYGLCLLPQK